MGVSDVGLNKIYFDKKGKLDSEHIDGAELIVLDKEAAPVPTPQGEVYPVRRLGTGDLADWARSLHPVQQFMFRARGSAQEDTVRFIFRPGEENMQLLDINAGSVASACVKFAGKLNGTLASFAMLHFPVSPDYVTDADLTSDFLAQGGDTGAIDASLTYAQDSVTLTVSGISTEAQWTAYIVFYTAA